MNEHKIAAGDVSRSNEGFFSCSCGLRVSGPEPRHNVMAVSLHAEYENKVWPRVMDDVGLTNTAFRRTDGEEVSKE